MTRTVRLLATCMLAWTIVAAAPWAHQVPDAGPLMGEVSLCLVPMASAAPPFGACSDHTPSWSGVEGLLNPD